jgi:hypothetical protein
MSADAHPLVQGPPTHLPPKFLPLSFSKDSVWQDSVFREITEPVLIIQEYIRLLKDSSGRVIIVSGCSQGRFLCESIHRNQTYKFPASRYPTAGYRFGCRSTLDEARRSIAHSVGCELKPFGVKVSSLVSGLLAAPNLPAQKILDELQVLISGMCSHLLTKMSGTCVRRGLTLTFDIALVSLPLHFYWLDIECLKKQQIWGGLMLWRAFSSCSL